MEETKKKKRSQLLKEKRKQNLNQFKRTSRLHMRLTEDERNIFNQLSNQYDKSITDLIVSVTTYDNVLLTNMDEIKTAAVAISRLVNNINQINRTYKLANSACQELQILVSKLNLLKEFLQKEYILLLYNTFNQKEKAIRDRYRIK